MRQALALVSILAITACGENITSPPMPTQFTTTTELRVRNPRTGTLDLVAPEQARHGIMASIANSQSLPAITVSSTSSTLSTGFASAAYDYTDSATQLPGRVTKFWPQGGGPATAMYQAIGGKVIATTVFTWARTSTGYYASRAVTTIYSPTTGASMGTSTVLAQTTTTSTPCNPKIQSCPPQETASCAPSMIGRLAFGLALLTSSPALAQGSSCVGEWARYLGAAALMFGSVGAAEVDWWAIGGTTIIFGDALWALERCQESGVSAPSPLRLPGVTGSTGGKDNFIATACASGTAGCLPAYNK